MDEIQQQKRISKPELRRLSDQMDSHKKEILDTIYRVKFITANQLQRIFFTKNEKRASNLRACNRMVNKLKSHGLVDHLEQRIGGKQSGSGSKIWTITSAGYNLLRLENQHLLVTRKRFYEPYPMFLEHSLAVSEIYTLLKELHRQKKIELLTIQNEPKCWRNFSDRGISFYVKPDLFASLIPAHENEYELSFYFELDRATEAPIRVIKKCKQYIAYYNSGIEQRLNGVFPYVIWITVNKKRQEQLIRYIQENLPKAVELFQVITIEEFESLICGEPSKEDVKNDL